MQSIVCLPCSYLSDGSSPNLLEQRVIYFFLSFIKCFNILIKVNLLDMISFLLLLNPSISVLSDSDTQMKPTKKIYFIGVLSELVSYLAIHLIFDQIVQDTEDPECLCLLKNKRMKIKQVKYSFLFLFLQ